MSQKYISTQKIKGKKIIFQNLQTKNDKSQIDFNRINTINNLQANYNFVKEYPKPRKNKGNKQAKEFSLEDSKLAQNIRKGASNLKNKILTIKTNSESNEQLKKKGIKKIDSAKYKKDFTNNNIKKKKKSDIINLINMHSNSSDNTRKKRNTNTNNHSYFISNNINNGHNNSNNNKNVINKININKKYGKDNLNGNNNNRDKDFKKINFKYFSECIKKSSEELFENIKSNNKNIVVKITNSFKDLQESKKKRNSEMEKENRDSIYNLMSLMRYENHIFLIELEKKQNKLVQEMFEKQNKLVQDIFEKQNKLVQEMFEKQREENMALLCNFVLMLNEAGQIKKNKGSKKLNYF